VCTGSAESRCLLYVALSRGSSPLNGGCLAAESEPSAPDL